MTGQIPPTGSTGSEFTRPIDNEQPTFDHKLPMELSKAGKSDPQGSTGLPKDVDKAYYLTQAAALGGLRYASA